MGDAQHLERRAERPQLAANHVGDPPADAGVDLVENQAGRGGARRPVGGVAEPVPRGRGQRLDREHHAGQLAARHDACERPEILAETRRDEELRRINPPAGPRGFGQLTFVEANVEPGSFHRELGDHGLQLVSEAPGDGAALLRQRPGGRQERRAGRGDLPLELDAPFVAAREVGALTLERVAARDDVGQGRAVLALEPLEQREALLDLLQPRRRGFDVVGVLPQKPGQVLELGLDAVARLQYG